MASLWEMAIKVSLGKLILPPPFDEFIEEQLEQNLIALLVPSISHISLVATLPFYHRDPFDRLIIAQSHREQMPLISRDTAFDAYPITRLW